MQAKPSPQVKTPAKRKSLNRKSIANSSPGGQNGVNKTPNAKKNVQGGFPLTPFVKAPTDNATAPTPNKKNVNTPKGAKTPKGNKVNTPKPTPNQKVNVSAVAETPNKTNNAGGNKKRKQSPVQTNGDASSPKQQKLNNNAATPKPQKLNKFPGTAKLDKSAVKKETSEKKKELKEKKIKNRQQKRKSIKQAFETLKNGGQLSPTVINSVNASILKLEEHVAAKDISRTGKRRLATYRKLQRLIAATSSNTDGSVVVPEKKQKTVPVKKEKVTQQTKVNVKKVKKEEENDSEEEDSDAFDDEDSEVDEDDVEEEEEDDVDEEEEEDDDDEDDDEEEEEEEEKKVKAVVQQKKNDAKGDDKNKSRYVLFVGNLPNDVTPEEVTQHFSKTAKVINVRIPQGFNNKPKGIGYVEFGDKESYEKALSLHHSFLKGRRINVEYTRPRNNANGGQKFNKQIQKKNFKLHGMRKQGMFPGGGKNHQKRGNKKPVQA